jgi:hypothetical protein
VTDSTVRRDRRVSGRPRAAPKNLVVVPNTSDPGYQLDVTLKPSANEAERHISFRGDRRTLTPPP